MVFQDVQGYLLPAAIVAFFAWRFLKFRKVKRDMPQFIGAGAVVVDVRSPAEFQQGSRPGSLNIPLGELNARSRELPKEKKIILCCASGSRSGMAVLILKKQGFSDVINAGPWSNTLT